MTTAIVEDKAAAEKAVADKAAADKASADLAAHAATDTAAADQAAADKAAADAGKTPEQIAAEQVAADAETERLAAESAKALESYTLTLPTEAVHLTDVDLQFIETEAKALKLTQEQAQSLVETRNASLAAQSTRFLTEAKADPEIGGPKWTATVQHAQAGVAFLFPDEADATVVRQWFDNTGLGNHKVFLKAMARIGRARAEDTPLFGTTKTIIDRKDTADVLYPTTAVKS